MWRHELVFNYTYQNIFVFKLLTLIFLYPIKWIGFYFFVVKWIRLILCVQPLYYLPGVCIIQRDIIKDIWVSCDLASRCKGFGCELTEI